MYRDVHHHPGRRGRRRSHQHSYSNGYRAQGLRDHRGGLGHRACCPDTGDRTGENGGHPSFDAAGTLVTYRYRVTNTGNVTLDPVTVTDPMPNLSAISCPDQTLAPGAFQTCNATYITTQDDVDAGSITNTGTANGTLPSGAAVTAQSSATVPAISAPAIGVVKSANVGSFDGPGASSPTATR